MSRARVQQAALLVCLLLLMGRWPTQAQDDAPLIEFFTPVIGTLAAGETQTWRVVALAGSMLSFRVEALEDTLDPVLTIATLERDLMTVDDAAPDDPNVLIEAFTVPRNGTYLLRVSGFDATSAGQYRLSIQPGYGTIQVQEDFAANPVWQTLIENEGTPLVDVQTDEENIRLIMEGIQQQSAVTVGDASLQFLDYYTSVDVTVQGNRGWQVGLLVRYQDEDNYTQFSINNQAQWRVTHTADGVETVLRDWSGHPALRQTNEFSMGAVVRGDLLEVFYDHQVLGSLVEPSGDVTGRIGFMATTGNAFGSSVDAAFDNWLVTTPAQGEMMPAPLLIGDGDFMVRELQRHQVIPAAGAMILRGQDARIQDVGAGVSRVDLQSTAYRDFVLSGYWSWTTNNAGVGGCGIAFRQDEEAGTYMLAWLDNSGAYGLAHREPEAFSPGLYGEGLDPEAAVYHVVLIAQGDALALYVDGQYIVGDYAGLADDSPDAGTIAQAVVNFDAVQTQCVFSDLWLWRIGG